MCLDALVLGSVEIVFNYYGTCSSRNRYNQIQDKLDGLRVNLHVVTSLRKKWANAPNLSAMRHLYYTPQGKGSAKGFTFLNVLWINLCLFATVCLLISVPLLLVRKSDMPFKTLTGPRPGGRGQGRPGSRAER